MRYGSVSTLNPDAYRAGLQIGEGLRELAPEVILLFASISYDPDFSEFFAGLADALEGQTPLIVGGTGDGVYESRLVADHGVCALGIHSDGAVQWSSALRPGVGQDSAGATAAAAREAVACLPARPDFCFVLADGAMADGTAVVEGLRRELDLPLFGGLSGDERKFARSRVFHGGREYEDAVLVLLGAGPLPFLLNAASGWTPHGECGVAGELRGSELTQISGERVVDFMARQVGKVLSPMDIGVMPLAVFPAEQEGRFFLRSMARLNEEEGSAVLFGSLPVGSRVQVCSASREEVLAGARQAVEGLFPLPPGFRPAAAVLISCAGRKWFLEGEGAQELEIFRTALGLDLPLVGIPSFGEIGPFRQPDGSYTPSCFHNVTFVVCLLGA